VSALGPGRFTLKKRVPRANWIGGWVTPRAGLDTVVKRKIPNPDHPARSPALYRLSYHDSQ